MTGSVKMTDDEETLTQPLCESVPSAITDLFNAAKGDSQIKAESSKATIEPPCVI